MVRPLAPKQEFLLILVLRDPKVSLRVGSEHQARVMLAVGDDAVAAGAGAGAGNPGSRPEIAVTICQQEVNTCRCLVAGDAVALLALFWG